MPHRGARRRIVTAAVITLIAALPPIPRIHASSIGAAAAPVAEWADSGMEALYRGDYLRAEELLNRYIDQAPLDPLGPLLRMKLDWWRILEGRDVDGASSRRLEADFEQVRELCKPRLEKSERDIGALYALGESYCTYGRLQGLRGSAWSTLRNHQKGAPLLEQALALDPDLVEPLTSLGVLHYYASRAPGFLRFLARFFAVQGDRTRALAELQRAATSPGIQQGEAAFFLLEVLTNVEDAHVEALPVALRFHQRYPQNLGFRIALAATQVGLGRPDAAVTLLQEALTDVDAPRVTAARFFLARVLGTTGRAGDAAALLEDFTKDDFERVSWLDAWHSYYLGAVYEQLGRPEDAGRQYERSRGQQTVADSRAFAERALERLPSELVVLAHSAEGAVSWNGDVERVRPELRSALANAPLGDETSYRATYALGMLEMQRGDYSNAARAFRSLVDAAVSDQAYLVVRPRVRLLQALLWGGQIEAAQAEAGRWRARLGEWGTNRHLELIIGATLSPRAHQTGFETAAAAPAGTEMQRFVLHDAGFTSVALELDGGGAPCRHRMRFRAGAWEIERPVLPGEHVYRFILEGEQPLPDPGCRVVRECGDEVWSVIRVVYQSKT